MRESQITQFEGVFSNSNLVVVMDTFKKAKGFKANGHLKLLVKGLIGICCLNLKLKLVVDLFFLNILSMGEIIWASVYLG